VAVPAASAGRGSVEPPAQRGAGPDRLAERRVCSVLFADLVGFTPLSAARDPEDVRELLSRYFEAARTVIGRYGGTVEKFIGDAVMAVWGAPVVAEGDAERAVRSAIDVVDAVAALGAELGAPQLAARAGVVTREVAVTLGATGEGMVAGDAVNTAARVQAAAEPGTVLVDATTRRLASAAIGFEDAGPHVLKGKAEPEQLWRATRVLAGVGGAQRVDGLEAPLTGRDAELRTIKELFHAAADRRSPRLVAIVGAAGVGKSRLGWEFEKYIDGLASTVWWHRGRCLSYGEGVAFWALAEAVRQRLGIAEEDSTDTAAARLASRLAEIVADDAERDYVAVRIGRLLGVPVPADSGMPLGRDELFAGWRTFFERLASIQPVVWLVEDAQYADTGLLDFCDHLVDWARDLPIFLLVLGRAELQERRPDFAVGRNRTLLALDPLDRSSMEALVEALVPGMPAAARQAIVGHAQGVPLFAVETIRSLIDRDVVVPVEGRYRLVGDVGELAVPDSLHGLLAARLDALGPAERALVTDAAVLGTSFPAEALVAVSGRPEAEVRDGLAELLRREVLEVSADPLSPQRGAYRFAQQLLRQVAYETLSRRDRKSRHLAVAAYLRATFADDGEEVSDVIARHYLDALDAVPDAPDSGELRDQAIAMSVRSAGRALRAGAPAAATASFAAAAELAEASGRADAADMWEQAAGAALPSAAWDQAVGYAERGWRLREAAGNVRAAARAQALVGRALLRVGRVSSAREHLTAALEVLRPEPDADTVAAMTELAALQVFAGEQEGEVLTEETLGLGQALDLDDATLSELFVLGGLRFNHQNRPVEAAASFEYAARLAERAGDNDRRGRALLNLSDVLLPADPPGAASAARRAADLLGRVGNRDMLAGAIANVVQVALQVGQWSEVDATLAGALDTDGLDDPYLLAGRGLLAALRGDPAAGREILGGLAGFRDSELPQDQATLTLLEAFIADAADEPGRALALARQVLSHARALSLRAETSRWAWPLAARTAHRLGDTSAVADLLAMLDGHPVGHLPPVLRAERELARARLLATTDPAAAGGLFDAAVAGLRRIPDPYHLGHALLDHAEYLAAAGESAAAAAATEEAAAIAERLGCEPLGRRVAAVPPSRVTA
jgi:class 3 adenylate cyclase/predicted ATPase